MIVKTPIKICQLFANVSELTKRDAALETKMSRLLTEVKGIGKGSEILSADWLKFYSREVTKEYMVENIEHHRYFIDLISDWANRVSSNHTPRLVEIGLGTATMSIFLSKRYSEVIGIDIDPLIVAKAMETNNRLGGHAKFIAMDAFDFQKLFRENTFDIAISQGTMEHFDNDALGKMLKAQLAVSKLVIFSVPSVNWPQEDFGNERKMTIEEWEKLLKDFGVKIEHISYYHKDDLHIAAVITSGDS